MKSGNEKSATATRQQCNVLNRVSIFRVSVYEHHLHSHTSQRDISYCQYRKEIVKETKVSLICYDSFQRKIGLIIKVSIHKKWDIFFQRE